MEKGLFIIRGEKNNRLCGITDYNVTSFTIPSTVDIIEKRSFKGCSLTEITIPDNVTTINEGAFSNCRKLTKVKMSKSVKMIAKNTFADCTSLREITLHESLRQIGERAFCRCSSLRMIRIPNGVTSIGKECFKDCRLESIVLPNSIEKIGFSCFSGCNFLKEVYIRVSDPKSLIVGDLVFDKKTNYQRILYVPFPPAYNQHVLKDYFKEIKRESNAEYTDVVVSGMRDMYLIIEEIETLLEPKEYYIVVEMAGKPDLPESQLYLKSKIKEIIKSEKYKQILSLYNGKKYWSIMRLMNEKQWPFEMIIRYAGKPDVKIFDFPKILPITLWLYSDERIREVEHNEAFISDIERYNYIRKSCFSDTDLRRRGWVERMIESIEYDIKQGDTKYYDKIRIWDIEDSELFHDLQKEYEAIFQNNWREEQLIEQGLTKYAIRKFAHGIRKIINQESFYPKQEIKKIIQSKIYKDYIKMRSDTESMLKLCLSGEITTNELLEDIIIEIPEIPEEELIDFCINSEYFNDDFSFDGFISCCIGIIRHDLTDYTKICYNINDYIKRRVSYSDIQKVIDNFHDRLQEKINDAIISRFGWNSSKERKRFWEKANQMYNDEPEEK